MSAERTATQGTPKPASVPRAAAVWRTIRQRGLIAVLAALTIFCWAAIPLYTSTERTHAEYQIAALQEQILQLQREKAQLTKELAERLRLDVLEKAAREEGLGPPVAVDYLAAP